MTDEFPRKGSSQEGTTHGYQVEARVMLPTPKKICGHMLDERWRELNFSKVPDGFGIPSPRMSVMGGHGLVDYEAAQALRWWFHANANAEEFGGALGLETRIVTVQIKYQWSHEAISADDYEGENLMLGSKVRKKP